jgi:VanZ family protein
MWKALLPAMIWWVVLTYCSVTTVPQLPKFSLFTADKLIHFGIYGLLNLFILGGFRKAGRALNPQIVLLSTVFCIIWGVLIECFQGLLPHRTFEFDDMLANAIGSILAVPSYWIARQLGLMT